MSSISQYQESSVVLLEDGSLSIENGLNSKALASATFNISYNATGWNELSVDTYSNSSASEHMKFYAAGYLEGYLTYQFIEWSWLNQLQILAGFGLNESTSEPIISYVVKNYEWIVVQAERNTNDPYWSQVHCICYQLRGLTDGIKLANPDTKIGLKEVLLLNYNGDLEDIIPAILFDTVFKIPTKFETHCSAFIRFTGEDLYCAHTTWESYITMSRIFKRYSLPSTDPTVFSNEVRFSGYPGALASIDDFYILDSGLFVTETTITNFNVLLYELLSTQTVPAFMRTIVSNRLANSSKQWCNIFEKYNSGTYNNQWMVVDHNLFTPGMSELLPNTVWIIEQAPDVVVSQDVTSVVNSQGYWGSYNVPYSPFIYDLMGYPLIGDLDSEASHNASRANIFKRDANKVNDIEAMKAFMQYNEYQTDPLSDGDPCNSISARCDLATGFQKDAMGGIDSKIVDHQGMLDMKAIAICGPTHETLAPFNWSDGWIPSWIPYGMPLVFDFEWVEMEFGDK